MSPRADVQLQRGETGRSLVQMALRSSNDLPAGAKSFLFFFKGRGEVSPAGGQTMKQEIKIRRTKVK